ncbi:MAG: hypothetical protein ACXWQO_05085 [Bdellovibrionota bacterium]
MHSIKEILRVFILKELKKTHGGSSFQLKDSDSLLLSDMTDSLFFVDLLIFLESRFSLKFDPMSISKEDLDTVDKMAALIESKR